MGFVLLLFVLLAVGAIWWMLHLVSETRRQMRLDRAARRMGMDFNFGLPGDLRDLLGRFRAIQKAREAGECETGVNTITGVRRGRPIVFFDYDWITDGATGRGVSRRRHARSAVAARMGVEVQPILIRPERLVDKAAALMGYEDIDFPSMPEFSRRFYVNSPDAASARRFVTPRVAQFFQEHVRLSADFVGPWLLLTGGSRFGPSDAPRLLDLAGDLAELITREQSGPS
jgi:hypothetical protein